MVDQLLGLDGQVLLAYLFGESVGQFLEGLESVGVVLEVFVEHLVEERLGLLHPVALGQSVYLQR